MNFTNITSNTIDYNVMHTYSIIAYLIIILVTIISCILCSIWCLVHLRIILKIVKMCINCSCCDHYDDNDKIIINTTNLPMNKVMDIV